MCVRSRLKNEVFQLGLVLNRRTLQPIRLAPFAAALTTCLLRFSVSACRQVLYFTNRLPLRTQEITPPASTTTPKLPRSKSRKHPPPSPLSRACVIFVYVLPAHRNFFSPRMSKISPATNQRASVNLPQRSAWSKGPPSISAAAASSSSPTVVSSAAPAATANGYQASHSRRSSAVVSMPQQGPSTLKGAVNVSKTVVQSGRYPLFSSEVGLLPARDVPHGVRTLINPDTNPLQLSARGFMSYAL